MKFLVAGHEAGKQALQLASAGQEDGEVVRVFALGENVRCLIRVPAPLTTLTTVAFAKKGSGVKVTQQDDLKQYSNVIVRGILHTRAITQGAPRVEEVNKTTSPFKMVDAGRADVAVSSGMDGLAALRTLNMDSIEALEPVLNTQPLYHDVHVSKKDIVPVIDAVLKPLEDSGELADLRNQMAEQYLATLG
ncbi:type 2 periplasmic-binding domain-containing protein [Roseobacter sinensis]|uniref:Solute-binding protein family 3/N-terminal domain-containing protein n=1 Tax=Roseobacter sinensis TaxID=2931391 RepID=A0ABT3BEQ6_9RHOB|nr:hypothetical protein [Roseobacter sp. WL0113]MCV3271854.1 hypothetical protein [Roseobacter sp. WL0113]